MASLLIGKWHLGRPTDVLPTDVLPTDVLPTDVLPTDVLPTAQGFDGYFCTPRAKRMGG